MFKDAFIKLDSAQAERMAALVAPHLDVKFDPAKSTVMIHNLSFYEGYFIVEISRHDQQPPITRTAICNDAGDVHVLDWSNEPIYQLNKNVPINLSVDSAADYVRFFFNYVRGPQGRFLLIDNVDDIDWREEPAAAGRKALGKMIEPLRLLSKEKDGTLIYIMTVVFKDSLFQAHAHVKPNGLISMQNEELLVEDIPVADDVFGQ